MVLTDINAARGAGIARELGDAAVFIEHDVADEAGWKRVVALAEAGFGKVTVLVNNAEIIGPVKGLLDLTQAEFLQVCAVNQLDHQHILDHRDAGNCGLG